jgi:hypothetical protein
VAIHTYFLQQSHYNIQQYDEHTNQTQHQLYQGRSESAQQTQQSVKAVAAYAMEGHAMDVAFIHPVTYCNRYI